MAYADFYNCNEHRKYPFVQPATGDLVFGADYVLPDDVILDAGFTLGADIVYDPTTKNILMTGISWTPTRITFTFSVLPGSAEFVFTRLKTDSRGATEYVEADGDPNKGVGFLVTGDLYAIIIELDLLYGTTGSLSANLSIALPVVEPSTIINIGGQRVDSVNVANLDRYQVDACCDSTTQYNASVGREVASGLEGDIKLHAGYNTRIGINPITNVATINAEQGAGDGEPCEEVKRWPTEEVPEGSNVLSGGPACGDLIFKINGVVPTDNGVFSLNGGSGISVVSYPTLHRIDIINNVEATLYCAAPDE